MVGPWHVPDVKDEPPANKHCMHAPLRSATFGIRIASCHGLCPGPGDIWRLGTCLDDAPGEAYDKLARAFEVASPSDMERLALKGDARKHRFGNMLASQRTCDFSFSGLKTKVLRVAQEPGVQLEDVVAGFQQAVIDHLTTRCERAVCYAEPSSFASKKGCILTALQRLGVC
eukprot:TRINITY_DN10612_c0_g1_i2.p1 TRINITY_DN10612_c0_g1~~TRINITY_DN10612_c0_g1_i2.p1  ORF type:complete len:172 (+),score=22.82 TRINITY_DN10612_c0_g1_i2:87-602(+)